MCKKGFSTGNNDCTEIHISGCLFGLFYKQDNTFCAKACTLAAYLLSQPALPITFQRVIKAPMGNAFAAIFLRWYNLKELMYSIRNGNISKTQTQKCQST